MDLFSDVINWEVLDKMDEDTLKSVLEILEKVEL